MGVIIIIFFIAIILAFGMLSFRAWEIKTAQVTPLQNQEQKILPEIHFRHVEKIMLHLAKYIIQFIVLTAVKYWFIISAKTKKWIGKNWPKVSKFFKKKTSETDQPQETSFVQKAVLESKVKIRKIKERVKKEHNL